MADKKGIELLSDLCAINAPSGAEKAVKQYIKERLKNRDGGIYEDAMGNLYYTVKGKSSSETIMVSAHMDEVGFMITGIEEDGKLRFSNVGGIDTSVMAGRRVKINGLNGVIGLSPVHLRKSNDRDNLTSPSEMFIDIGAKDREYAQNYVKIGDYASISAPFSYFGNGKMLAAKATDDRLGCAVMIDVIDSLEGNTPDNDIVFAFTVREEIGASGAFAASKRVKPKYSLVLETTSAADLPSVPYTRQVAKTGCGPAVSFADGGTVYNECFYQFVLQTADRHGIKAQPKRFTSGGNDAAYIHSSNDGVITTAISVPTRYLHSASCVINTEDYFYTRDLIKAIISDISLFRETEVAE